MIFEIIFILFLCYIILFFFSISLKDNSIVDVFWPVGFLIITIISFFLTQTRDLTKILILLLIFIWAIRLSLYIYIKKRGKKGEDPRYKIWRETWKYFYIRSFFQVYILQMILMLLISTPIIILMSNTLSISFLFYLGLVISCIGLIYESIGDFQLYQFLKKKKNNLTKEKILKTGLWKYSRHPNYFGEALFWFGIGVSIFNVSIFSFFGFLVIFILLRFVSGVPPAERGYIGDKEFEKYKIKTPAMFPNFFLK